MPLPTSPQPPYAVAPRLRRSYVAVNLIVVTVLYLVFLAVSLPVTAAGLMAHVILVSSAAAILAKQYVLLLRTRSVLLQLLILYVSMLLFVAEVGAFQGLFHSMGSSPAGSLAAVADGALRYAVISHVVTWFLFPPVAALGLLIVRGDQKAAAVRAQ